MLTAFLAGMIVGALVFWKISSWWRASSIKKASDAVGSAAAGPAKAAKSLFRKAKDMVDSLVNPKDDKEDR